MIRSSAGIGAGIAIALCAVALVGTPGRARTLPPAPWIQLAPSQRFVVVRDAHKLLVELAGQPTPSLVTQALSHVRQSFRRRIGSTMLDFHPTSRLLPLQLSGGMRTLGRRDALFDTAWLDTDRRIDSDVTRVSYGADDVATLRVPGVTLGYQRSVARNVLLGVEGGAMVNHAMRYNPARGRPSTGPTPDDIRPMLDPTVALYFTAAL